MLIRLSDKHLMHSLASVFELVSSAFNVSMFIWSLPVAVQFVISRSLLPLPMMLSAVPRLNKCGLWYFVHCHVAQCRILLFVLWSYLGHGLFYPSCPGVA